MSKENEIEDIKCEQAIKMLLEYLDHELNGHHHMVVEKHLHTCRSCYSRMEFEKRLKGIVSDKKDQQAPDSLRERLGKLF